MLSTCLYPILHHQADLQAQADAPEDQAAEAAAHIPAVPVHAHPVHVLVHAPVQAAAEQAALQRTSTIPN